MQCQSIKCLEEKGSKVESFLISQLSSLESWCRTTCLEDSHWFHKSASPEWSVATEPHRHCLSILLRLLKYRYIFIWHLFSETKGLLLNVRRPGGNLLKRATWKHTRTFLNLSPSWRRYHGQQMFSNILKEGAMSSDFLEAKENSQLINVILSWWLGPESCFHENSVNKYLV